LAEPAQDRRAGAERTAAQPEHVQLTEPDRVGSDALAPAALVKVNVPEPSARTVAATLAPEASGLKLALPTVMLAPTASMEDLV